jgi:hypothetical protein
LGDFLHVFVEVVLVLQAAPRGKTGDFKPDFADLLPSLVDLSVGERLSLTSEDFLAQSADFDAVEPQVFRH